MIFHLRKNGSAIFVLLLTIIFISCEENETVAVIDPTDPMEAIESSSSASYPELVRFRSTNSSETGLVYEVLPEPAALDESQSPTPFSNNTVTTSGSYSYCIDDKSPEDSEDSQDAVATVNIRFTGNDGREFKIDKIDAIHKAEGTGEHTFFGGTATNKVIHGNTGVGTNLEPKLLAYIALWGKTDLKDANTGEVIAPNRMIHIMTTSNVRDENRDLITSRDVDSTDHNFRKAQTHVILSPMDMEGNMDPIPGTDHGFLHMMFEQVELTDANRDPRLVYEILPGPAEIDPTIDPSSFSNNIAYAAGSYSYHAKNSTENDSEDSEDEVNDFKVEFERLDGTTFIIDNVNVIHKAEGTGEHTFFGGVGNDKIIHGNTGIGTNLEPKLLAYIAFWGTADLKDGDGYMLASNRMIHVMTTSRVRTDNLKLITDTKTDQTDHSLDKVETHIILPPMDLDGNMSPVPGSGHGFLHLMFEEVTLNR